MRGRILLTIILGGMALAACSKRDSLYIEPGKAEASPPKKTPETPQQAPAAKPAEAPPKR